MRSQTTRNRRIHPWPLRLSGEKARSDQAARRGFCRWSFFNRASQAASTKPRGIPNLNLTRHRRGTAKEVNNTIIKSAPSGACWSTPIQLPTGSTGVACRQAHSGRTGWCPKIESATADRKRYGSPVIRNTYQIVFTINDLNDQLRLKEGGSKRRFTDQEPAARLRWPSVQSSAIAAGGNLSALRLLRIANRTVPAKRSE